MDALATPLSPWTYLRRNRQRVWPVLWIQALVTALLVAIITPTNAFRATSETYLRALQFFTSVTPSLRNDFDEALLSTLDANPHMAHRIPAKAFYMHTPMIVGKGYAPLLALPPEHQQAFLDRVGLRLVEGALPRPDTPDAAVHAAVLRARGLRLGDTFGRLVDPTDVTPGRFVVSGVLDGEARLGLVDFAWAGQPLSVFARTPPFQVVYAKGGQKAQSDRYLREATTDEGLRVFRSLDATFAKQRLDQELKNLPLIVGFLSIVVAAVVALVSALLSVIAFQGRVEERCRPTRVA